METRISSARVTSPENERFVLLGLIVRETDFREPRYSFSVDREARFIPPMRKPCVSTGLLVLVKNPRA